jgi:hypothetical protein
MVLVLADFPLIGEEVSKDALSDCVTISLCAPVFRADLFGWF